MTFLWSPTSTNQRKSLPCKIAKGISVAGLLFTVTSVASFAQSTKAASSCAQLAKLDLPEATITMAEVVQPMAFKLPTSTTAPGGPGAPGGPPGGQAGPGGGPPGVGGGMALAAFNPKDTTNHVPFCRVAATLKPSGDSNIKVEVWLPLSGWNGKLMGAGNFGWAGSIMYGGLLLGLEQGYAVVSTDTGHDTSLPDGAFALGHPDKMIDYGYPPPHRRWRWAASYHPFQFPMEAKSIASMGFLPDTKYPAIPGVTFCPPCCDLGGVADEKVCDVYLGLIQSYMEVGSCFALYALPGALYFSV